MRSLQLGTYLKSSKYCLMDGFCYRHGRFDFCTFDIPSYQLAKSPMEPWDPSLFEQLKADEKAKEEKTKKDKAKADEKAKAEKKKGR